MREAHIFHLYNTFLLLHFPSQVMTEVMRAIQIQMPYLPPLGLCLW
jgi:hypothetical protein